MHTAAWKTSYDALAEQSRQLTRLRDDYSTLENLLIDLREKAAAKCLVPICGSKMVMCPGQIVNTNVVLCQLSEDYYVRRTVANCIEKTLKPRRRMAETVLEENNLKMKELQTRLNLSAGSETPGVVINSEGFHEIIEFEPDPPVATEQLAKKKMPLIEEIEKPPPPPAQPKPSPVLFEVVEREPVVPAKNTDTVSGSKSIFAQEVEKTTPSSNIRTS